MMVNILFFGPVKDITGSDTLVMEDISDTSALLAALQQKFPAIAHMRFVMAVDKKIIQHNTSLQHNSTVAVMPPFSGG